MKKAEKYLEDAIDKLYDIYQPWFDNNVYDGTIVPIIQAIRQAQIDAIDETVKRCVKEANLFINNLSSTDKEYLDYYQCGDDLISVNREGILEIANKLKKELK